MFTGNRTLTSILSSLRRQWLLIAFLWVAVWLGSFILLRPVWPLSGRWLLLSGLVLSYGLWVLWRNLSLNHRTGEVELLPGLGSGNALTLMRGLCIGLIAGFLFGPWPMGGLAWVIVLLYTAADIADYLDGYLARRANHVTPLGSILDVEFDGMGTLVVILLAVSFGQLPVWYLGLGLARYLFVFGLWLRKRIGRPIYEMPASAHRRVFAGFQMGFLSVVLWPIVPRSGAIIAGTMFAGATGIGFLRDWLAASGTINPSSQGYKRIHSFIYLLFARYLPPLWRLSLAIAMFVILREVLLPFPPAPWRDLLAGWGVPGASLLAALFALIALFGTPLVGLGILSRLISIALCLPIGFDIASRGLLPENAVALACVIGIQLLGPGLLAFWPVEEPYIFRRLGEL